MFIVDYSLPFKEYIYIYIYIEQITYIRCTCVYIKCIYNYNL